MELRIMLREKAQRLRMFHAKVAELPQARVGGPKKTEEL
jgi:hypothetical protein